MSWHIDSQQLYPLTFAPVFRQYMWGGRNLEKLGRALPEGIVAESWEISGHPTSPTVVDAGPFSGKPLTALMEELGILLVGTRNEDAIRRRRFPLLVKLLDAQRDLSVQVHPPDWWAQQHENGEWGKTEMWYILQAVPGARIVYGLRKGVTPEDFRSAVQAGRVEECLHFLPVRAGDAISLPAGCVHALLAGMLVVEIQQTSDLTYRIYDWNRLDSDGHPRPLHVEKALAVIDFDMVEPLAFQPELAEVRDGLRRYVIGRSRIFTVERVVLDEGGQFLGECDGSTFEIWGCVEGSSQIHWAHGALALEGVRFVLLPAALGKYTMVSLTPSTLLRVFVEG